MQRVLKLLFGSRRGSKASRRPRLGQESLERREVMTTLSDVSLSIAEFVEHDRNLGAHFDIDPVHLNDDAPC